MAPALALDRQGYQQGQPPADRVCYRRQEDQEGHRQEVYCRQAALNHREERLELLAVRRRDRRRQERQSLCRPVRHHGFHHHGPQIGTRYATAAASAWEGAQQEASVQVSVRA